MIDDSLSFLLYCQHKLEKNSEKLVQQKERDFEKIRLRLERENELNSNLLREKYELKLLESNQKLFEAMDQKEKLELKLEQLLEDYERIKQEEIKKDNYVRENEREIELYNTEVKEVKEKYKEVQKELEVKKSELKESANTYTDLKDFLITVKAENDVMREKAELYEKEIKSLEEDILCISEENKKELLLLKISELQKPLQRSLENCKRTQREQCEVEEILASIVKLSLDSTSDQLTEFLTNSVKVLLKEKESILETLEISKQELQETLEERYYEESLLQKRFESLREEVREKEVEVLKLREGFSNLTERESHLVKRKEELKSELRYTNDEMKRLLSFLEAEQDNLARANQNERELFVVKIDELEEELSKLRSKNFALSEEINSKRLEINKNNTDLEEFSKERKQQLSLLKAYKTELTQVKKELSEIEKRNLETIQSLRWNSDQLEGQVYDKEEEIGNLQSEIEKLKSNVEDTNRRNEELIHMTQVEKVREREKFEELLSKKSVKVKKFKQEVKSQKERITVLENELAELELKGLNKDFVLMDEVDILKEELENLRENCNYKELRIEEMTHEIEKERKEGKNEKDALEAELKELEERIKFLEKDTSEVSESNLNLKKTAIDLEKETLDLHEQVKLLEDQLKLNEKLSKELQLGIDTLKLENKEVREFNDVLKTQVDNLTAEREELLLKVEELKVFDSLKGTLETSERESKEKEFTQVLDKLCEDYTVANIERESLRKLREEKLLRREVKFKSLLDNVRFNITDIVKEVDSKEEIHKFVLKRKLTETLDHMNKEEPLNFTIGKKKKPSPRFDTEDEFVKLFKRDQ